MKKKFTPPVVKLVNMEPAQIIASSESDDPGIVGFSEGTTDIMHAKRNTRFSY